MALHKCTGRGGGRVRPGTISPRINSPGENFPTLEIPKVPSVIRPNDCNKRHKTCTRQRLPKSNTLPQHCHRIVFSERVQDQQHRISCVCARNGWLRRVRRRAWPFSGNIMPAAVARYGTVPPKLRQGKMSPPFLTAKFSRRNPSKAKAPPPVQKEAEPLGGGGDSSVYDTDPPPPN